MAGGAAGCMMAGRWVGGGGGQARWPLSAQLATWPPFRG